MISVLFAGASAAPAARAQEPASSPSAPTLEELARRVEKLEGAPAKTSLGSFNPALGVALDGVLRDSNDKAGFLFRAAEINMEAPVDPFLKAWAVFTGSDGGVEVEEAVMETTGLPYNLTVRGGRLFASFGRMAHFHDHELPTIDRPRSLDSFVGGESRADGVEASYLLPTDLFVTATLGAYNKLGADNDRQKDQGARPLDEFTYLGRVNTYFDLTDSQSLELGADSAWTPKRRDVAVSDTWRTLSGLDVTYRYQPPAGGLYKSLLWGAEILRNDERGRDATTALPASRSVAYGGCSYVELKTGRRWRGGVLADLSEDLADRRLLTKTFTGFLTYDVTEFQRLRATYAQTVAASRGAVKNHTAALQWTAVFGSHVHGFRDR